MGFLSGILSGSSNPVTSMSTTGPQKWFQDQAKDIFSQGETLANRPYPTYPGQRIAPLTPLQQQGIDLASSSVGNWKPLFEQAASLNTQAGTPVSAEDINTYMNPYVKNAIDPTIQLMNEQYQRDRIARNATVSRGGSFLNEDRRAAIENQAQQQLTEAVGAQSGQMYMDAFKTALNQANTTKEQQRLAGTTAADLGKTLQAMGITDANTLQAAGKIQQDLQQAGLTMNWQDFLNQFNYPADQVQWLVNLLAGTPKATTTTTTSPEGAPNILGEGLGALTSIGSLFSAPSGGTSAISGIGNAISSIFG